MADIENQVVRNDDLQLIVVYNGTRRFYFIYIYFIASLLCVSLVILYFIFIIYSIISLCKISYYEQKELCRDSDIWVFIIVCLTLTPLLSSNIIQSYTKDNKAILKNCFIYAIIIIWGLHECFIVDCVSELYNTLLYFILEINIVYGILLLFVVGILISLS